MNIKKDVLLVNEVVLSKQIISESYICYRYIEWVERTAIS